MLLPMLIQTLVSLVEPPAPPPVAQRVERADLVVFTEAGGRRAHLVGDGDRVEVAGPAVFTEVGEVAGGLQWGPAYVIVDACIPEVMAPEVGLGLRVKF